MLFLTVQLGGVAPEVLRRVGLVLAVGNEPTATLRDFCQAAGEPAPAARPGSLETGHVLAWRRDRGEPPVEVRTIPPRTERVRHSRKYAEGDLGDDRSFYFRGPDGRLNLRAQNLAVFLQMAEGVDDATWTYHLRRGDYSSWFRRGIKDNDLADAVAPIEAEEDRSPEDSRAAIREAIETRYTLPSGEASGEQE